MERQVIFEPVKLKAKPSWYVRVAFPSGQQTYVSGFNTKADARNWIKRDASRWLTHYRGAQ
jgi:hypothetical protein